MRAATVIDTFTYNRYKRILAERPGTYLRERMPVPDTAPGDVRNYESWVELTGLTPEQTAYLERRKFAELPEGTPAHLQAYVVLAGTEATMMLFRRGTIKSEVYRHIRAVGEELLKG